MQLFTRFGSVMLKIFFPGPQAFCKKAMERVRSEKNILNSSVEWSGWSGFFQKKTILCTSSDRAQ